MRKSYAKSRVIKAICVLLALSFNISCLSGCGKSSATGNYKNINGVAVDSSVLGSNANYELRWDSEAGAVVLCSAALGMQWSDILYGEYKENGGSANGNSPITITVSDNTTLKWDNIRSYQEKEDGYLNTVCKKLEDGIRVTYFFKRYKIAIPIEYRLRNDSLCVSVISSKILESGEKYKLVSVTLTPNLCSVKNSENGAYLFVPSGSGAVMYAAENADGVRSFSGEVYGEDAARQKPNNFTDSEPLLLPVFGAAGGGAAMLGIIESGAGSAFIEAKAGNERLGYSTAGATFYLRGYDEFRFASLGTGNITTKRIADNLCRDTVSVGFYPLYGEQANYNGMAQRYRKYLEDNKMITKNKAEYSPYSVTVIGGTEVTKTVMGIPKTDLTAATAFSEAKEIISALLKDNGIAPVVRMMYYGDRGITPGTIGGGKGFASVYGNGKALDSLNKLCSDNKITLFMDSEIVRFTKSGNGVSVNSGSSKTAIKHIAERYAYLPIRFQDEGKPVYVISRGRLEDAANRAIKKTVKSGFAGISLSSLGNTAFSDYSDGGEYANKRKIEEQTGRIFASASKNGLQTAAAGANSYAAAAADILFDVPAENGGYDVFDSQIPFYQMVFGNLGPMYTRAVNISENPLKTVMWAAISGMGIGFTVCASYIDGSDDLAQYKLYAALFEDNESLVTDALIKTGFKDCFNAVFDSGLSSYEMLDGNISRSTFKNGAVIYANHNSEPTVSPAGELAAYGFKLQ